MRYKQLSSIPGLCSRTADTPNVLVVHEKNFSTSNLRVNFGKRKILSKYFINNRLKYCTFSSSISDLFSNLT